MIVYLMGYMGCGKTTTGKKLASKLYYRFMDLDRRIEEGEGEKIERIFALRGEEEFRRLETRYLSELTDNDDMVVSLGGGTPCYHLNMEIIKSTGYSIYIKMPVKALVNRLIHSKRPRPVIQHLSPQELEEFVAGHLAQREPFYLRADYVADGLRDDWRRLAEVIRQQKRHFQG